MIVSTADALQKKTKKFHDFRNIVDAWIFLLQGGPCSSTSRPFEERLVCGGVAAN
jgi:hypothetical protein